MKSLVRDEDAVMDLVRETYYLREKRALVADPLPLARRTAQAVARLVEVRDGYNPEDDVRVAWLRDLCRSLIEHRGRYPQAAGELEAGVQFLLGEMPAADPRLPDN